MTDALEQWFTRFAAGAGTLYRWTMDREGLIRAPYLDDWSLTPRSAALLFDYGVDYESHGLLGSRGGLSSLDICMLSNCENNDRTQDPRMRARLLQICRLSPSASST